MRSDFKYDVFISFSHHDSEAVMPIYRKLTEFGLQVFWSAEKLKTGYKFTDEIQKALNESQHLAIYCTKNAIQSKWVSLEWQSFLTEANMKDEKHRLIYVLHDDTCTENDIPQLLQNFQRPRSGEQLITDLVRATIKFMEEDLSIGMENFTKNFEQKESEYEIKITQIQKELQISKKKMDEARNYYRYNRFWNSIAENRDIHIFTCGRNIPNDPNSPRGYGGRTNIDMWDYRAVLDITHFFASKYPNTKITIEDPMSKLIDEDFKRPGHIIGHTAILINMIQDKDCIIIGSPNISDFAEIVLSRIHKIDPYTDGRTSKKGFVIIRDKKYSRSSFNWWKENNEDEGVAQILVKEPPLYFSNIQPTADGSTGRMFGILVVASNPFCNSKLMRKIIIMSGFSGVATNGISKMLTDDRYIHEFFKFDNEYVNLEKDIEALISVEYILDNEFMNRDSRRKKQITYEKLVEI